MRNATEMSGNTTSICGGEYGCRLEGVAGRIGPHPFTVAFECCGLPCYDVCTLSSTVPTLAGWYMMFHVLAQGLATLLVKAIVAIVAAICCGTGAACWFYHFRQLRKEL